MYIAGPQKDFWSVVDFLQTIPYCAIFESSALNYVIVNKRIVKIFLTPLGSGAVEPMQMYQSIDRLKFGHYASNSRSVH